MPLLIATAVALVVGLLVQPVVIGLLRRRGVLDHPTERSSHTVATVRGGGVAVLLALLAGAAAGGALADRDAAVVLLVTALCALVGFAEDVRGIPVVPRFALLLLACAPLALLVQGPPVRTAVLGLVAVVFGVAVVNSVNFMDGINGISAAQGLVAGVVFAGVAAAEDLDALAVVGAATAAASLSFAPYNVPRARVFLGDAGSYGLGAMLAGTVVALLAAGVSALTALAPLAVYLADTGSTLVRRFRAGETWYLPHRTHAYQRLTDLGWSHVRVSSVVLACMVACSAFGVAALRGGTAQLVAATGVAIVLAAYLSLPELARRRSLA